MPTPNLSHLTHEDLIERVRQLEARVAELEAQSPHKADILNAIVDSTPIGIAMHGPDSTFLDYHGAAHFNVTREEVTGKTVNEVFSAQHASDVRARLAQVFATGEPLQVEVGLNWRGRDMALAVHYSPVFDAHGNVRAVCRTGVDVTELAQTRDAYRALAEQTSLALVIFQNDTVVFANEAAAALSDYERDQILGEGGESPWTNIHPDDRAAVQADYAARMRGEERPNQLEFRIMTRTGQVKWVEAHITRFHYNGQPAIQLTATDITERKQATDSLQASEARYRLIADNINDIIFLINPDHTVRYVSPSVERVLGYPPDHYLGRASVADIHPDDVEAIVASREAMNKSGELRSVFRSQHKDGHYVWMDTLLRAIHDDSGTMLYYTGISRDITERKQAEDALRESEARFRLIAENVRDIVMTATMDGAITYVSPSMRRVLGQDPSAVIGRQILEIVPEEDLGVMEDAARLAEAHPEFAVTHRLRHADGHLLWFEASTQMVKGTDSTPAHAVGVLREITEQRRMSAELEENRRFLHEVADAAPYMIYVFDLSEGRNVYSNEYNARVLGMTKEEAARTTLDKVFPVYHPDDRHIFDELAAAYHTAADGDVITKETRIRVPEGDWHWFQLRVIIFERTADGAPRQVLGMALDIHEQKAAEAAALRLAGERARAQFIARFIEDAAHELRTPLSSINMALHMLRRTDDPAKHDKFIDRIDGHTAHLERLIETLFTMLRLQDDDEFEFFALDPSDVLREVVVEAVGAAAEADVTLVPAAGDFPAQLVGDADYLKRAFAELVRNAIQQTPPGGTVSLHSAVVDDVWQVRVQDTGPGVPEAEREAIFDSFHRLDHARSTGGFGLGLTIARRIVAAHGGSITVEAGTTFAVTLPRPPR